MASKIVPGIVLRTNRAASQSASTTEDNLPGATAKRKHEENTETETEWSEPRPVREGLVDTRESALVDVRLKTQRTLTAGACHLDAFYNVPKTLLGPHEFERSHKSKLVVQRKGASTYGGEPLVAFSETSTHYVLPRFYGLTQFGPCPDRTSLGAPMKPGITFVGTLREGFPPQREAAELMLAHLQNPTTVNGCTVVMPCGTGKTVLMLYVVTQLARRAGIVLPDVSLIDQTRAAIERFFPEARIGLVHRQKFMVDDTDIVLMSLKTLIHAKATFAADQFDSIGTLWVDEAHHMTATQFVKTFRLFRARNVGGQTATLRRRDGTAHALQWFMGPKVLQVYRSHERVRVLRLFYFATRELKFRNGNLNMPGIHTAIVHDARRNVLMIRALMTALRGHPCIRAVSDFENFLLKTAPDVPSGELPRTAIVLVHRKVHAYFLLMMLADIVGTQVSFSLTDNGFCECVLEGPNEPDVLGEPNRSQMLLTTLLGDFKPAQRTRAKEGDVIFATYNMAQEGLDIPRVDTVLLGTPKSDVEQSVGRAEREHATKCPPLIIDMADLSVGLFSHMANTRRDFYAEGLMQMLKLLPDNAWKTGADPHLSSSERLLSIARRLLSDPLPAAFVKEDPDD